MIKHHSDKRLVIGILILCIGLFLILNKLTIIPPEVKDYLFHWELILVGIGLISVISREGRSGPGYLFILVGGLLYARNFFDIFSFNFWQLFWPALLIFVGLLMILKRKHTHRPFNMGPEETVDEDVLDEVAIFGGNEKLISSQNFKGGKITAIFGGSNLNLSRAKLSPGKQFIDVIAVFGGMKMIVPEEWDIRIKVVPIFGGFSDKHRIKPDETIDTEGKPQLIIKGVVFFGGGEIKSY